MYTWKKRKITGHVQKRNLYVNLPILVKSRKNIPALIYYYKWVTEYTLLVYHIMNYTQ